MRLQIQLFAAARQWAGVSVVELDVPATVIVADIRRALVERVPQLNQFGSQLRLAVNSQYADDSMQVPPNAKIACIPPVSGG